MKNLWSFFKNSPARAKEAPKRAADVMEGKIRLCNHHETRLYPNIIANETCNTCNTQVCYMCGHKHIMGACEVECIYIFKPGGKELVGGYEKVREVTNDAQFLLNYGYVGTLYLEALECPCGTKITSSDKSAECTACGTWTCSKECHDKYISGEDLCTFHHNFSKNLQNMVKPKT